MGIPLGHLDRRVTKQFFERINVHLATGCLIGGIGVSQVVETGGGDTCFYPNLCGLESVCPLNPEDISFFFV